MNIKYVAAEDLSSKLGDKKCLYDLLSIDLNLCLPPYKKCSIRFIKDIFAKRKRGITKLHERLLAVPRYKELSTSKVFALVFEVPELMIYFPDLEQNELPDSTFMWKILSTFREDAVKSLIEEARKSRDASK